MNFGILFGASALLVIWGVWGLVAKFALREVDMQIALWSQIASLTLIPLYFVLFREMTPVKFVWAGMGWAYLSGLLGAGGTIVLYLLLRSAPLSVVIPISALYPVVTVVLSAIILKEKVGPLQIVGLVLAVAAIWLLSSNSES